MELKIGGTVQVASRTTPGIYKEGGVAFVEAINADGTINVKYVVGTRKEIGLDRKYVSEVSPDQGFSSRRRSRGGVTSTGSEANEKEKENKTPSWSQVPSKVDSAKTSDVSVTRKTSTECPSSSRDMEDSGCPSIKDSSSNEHIATENFGNPRTSSSTSHGTAEKVSSIDRCVKNQISNDPVAVTATPSTETPKQEANLEPTSNILNCDALPPTKYSIGQLVDVAARTQPGMNEEGGVAVVSAVCATTSLYNVSYVIGSRKEEGVHERFIKPHVEETGKRSRRKRDLLIHEVNEPSSTSAAPKGKGSNVARNKSNVKNKSQSKTKAVKAKSSSLSNIKPVKDITVYPSNETDGLRIKTPSNVLHGSNKPKPKFAAKEKPRPIAVQVVVSGTNSKPIQAPPPKVILVSPEQEIEKAKEDTRQEEFRQAVSHMFQKHNTDNLEFSTLNAGVKHALEDSLSDEEFSKRLNIMDQRDRILVLEEDDKKMVYLV